MEWQNAKRMLTVADLSSQIGHSEVALTNLKCPIFDDDCAWTSHDCLSAYVTVGGYVLAESVIVQEFEPSDIFSPEGLV